MTTLSLNELLKGISDPVLSGVFQAIATADQLTSAMPWESIGSTDTTTYKREKTRPGVSKVASGGTITPTAALEYDRVMTRVHRMVVDQDIDILDAGASGGMMSVRADAIAQAAKAIGETYGDDIITGNTNYTATVKSTGTLSAGVSAITVGPGHDPSRALAGTIRYTHSGTTLKYRAPGDQEFGAAVTAASGATLYSDNPNKWITVTYSASLSANEDVLFEISGGDNEVDGLQRLVTSAQTLTASGADGDAISFAGLDRLLDAVKNTDGMKVLVMNATQKRKVAALLRGLGGATLSEVRSELSPSAFAASYLTYNGVPILVSDYIPATESKGSSGATLTSAYCATLGPRGGLCGIYSEASADAEDAGEVIARGVAGMPAITVLNVGTVQNADTKRVRVKAYWGVKNPSPIGIARLSQLTP